MSIHLSCLCNTIFQCWWFWLCFVGQVMSPEVFSVSLNLSESLDLRVSGTFYGSFPERPGHFRSYIRKDRVSRRAGINTSHCWFGSQQRKHLFLNHYSGPDTYAEAFLKEVIQYFSYILSWSASVGGKILSIAQYLLSFFSGHCSVLFLVHYCLLCFVVVVSPAHLIQWAPVGNGVSCWRLKQ